MMLQGVQPIDKKGVKVQPQITEEFVLKLIRLFQSPDPRERDYLKTILHKLYGKCLSLRGFIRQKIIDQILDESNFTEKPYGYSEYLEILTSIIAGYN